MHGCFYQTLISKNIAQWAQEPAQHANVYKYFKNPKVIYKLVKIGRGFVGWTQNAFLNMILKVSFFHCNIMLLFPVRAIPFKSMGVGCSGGLI